MITFLPGRVLSKLLRGLNIKLTIRPKQGWQQLLTNWDFEIGRFSASMCWHRPHRIGIGYLKQNGSFPDDWVWYQELLKKKRRPSQNRNGKSSKSRHVLVG